MRRWKLDRGQAHQRRLPPDEVPVRQVGLEVAPEALERRPLLTPVELVLEVAEEPLRACVVQAVLASGAFSHK